MKTESIESIRKTIDSIGQKLLQLINERLTAAVRIGHLHKQKGRVASSNKRACHVRQPERLPVRAVDRRKGTGGLMQKAALAALERV